MLVEEVLLGMELEGIEVMGEPENTEDEEETDSRV